ncbi:flagellar motor switch protein FliG [bacterium]|nr:flagellar motor switch protein FliG [bacterium]MBU1983896.1 flagellar motor switch protein FliG [bacterium]
MSPPRSSTGRRLTAPQKAAVLMITVGSEASAAIYKNLQEDEIEEITRELVSLRNVESSTVHEVVEEFYTMMKAQDFIAVGGVTYAEEVLEKSLGHDRAVEILRRIERMMKVRGFNILKNVDAHQLLAFIQKEHPQTIAFVLTQLSPSQSSAILSDLPPELQADVIYRFANMERVAPETIASVEAVLESRIDFSQGASKLGGVKAAAEVLNMIGQSAERSILSKINEQAPELATAIKNLMFVFEDIVNLDDRSIQRVLKEVDNKELALALKHVSPDVKKRVTSNLSQRASQMIQEEIEYMGPVRLKDVEEAQQRVVDIIRNLEEAGQVVIIGGTKAEEMVE